MGFLQSHGNLSFSEIQISPMVYWPFCVIGFATFPKVKSSKTVYTSQKSPLGAIMSGPRISVLHISPDGFYTYRNFCQQSKTQISRFTEKANGNGGFPPKRVPKGAPGDGTFVKPLRKPMCFAVFACARRRFL